MTIKKIRISNFKSFRELEIGLGKFNVLIGANASGKSNFIQIFKFLRDITHDGLDTSISLQGGVKYLRNIAVDNSMDSVLEVIFDTDFRFINRTEEKPRVKIGVKIYEVTYKLILKYKKKGLGFEISEELKQKCKFFRLKKENQRIKEGKLLGVGELTVSNMNKKVDVRLSVPENIPIKKDNVFPPFLDKKLKSKLFIENPLYLFAFFPPRKNVFSNIAMYDFDSKLPKRAIPITGKAELKEDGSNLAIVLKAIMEDKEKEKKFFNLVRDLLPFVDDLDTEKLADKSLLFNLKESYFKKHYLPASLMSDGTINIIALIIALYFEKKTVTIIEEPERNIHPHLISKVIDMMKEKSKDKQVIVTTHNPEIVKYAGIENILLISRDKNGFSTISKPAEKDEIKTFLKNQLGLEELYVQNLLEL